MLPRNAPVVVGVSVDQPSVLLYALREAARLRTTVRVVHCYAALAGDVYVGSDSHEAMRAAGAEVLTQARKIVEASDPSAEVEYILERGDPGACLVDEAKEAHVMVVGADDASWLERMLGGNVSGHLALHAACPVVVVPQSSDGNGRTDGVIVTLDGDTSSAGPLRYGFEQADFRTEELHVLHATPVATTAQDTAVLTAKVESEVARWSAMSPNVQVRFSVTTGDVRDECIRATSRASLLVIGRPHGHAMSFALTRPLALVVLREARCPVAIVPADYGSQRS